MTSWVKVSWQQFLLSFSSFPNLPLAFNLLSVINVLLVFSANYQKFNFFLQVWPYPCPRPTFKCCWLYRTASLESLQSVALQLRILWACLKWDDMHTKPATLDGKNQVLTRSGFNTVGIQIPVVSIDLFCTKILHVFTMGYINDIAK